MRSIECLHYLYKIFFFKDAAFIPTDKIGHAWSIFSFNTSQSDIPEHSDHYNKVTTGDQSQSISNTIPWLQNSQNLQNKKKKNLKKKMELILRNSDQKISQVSITRTEYEIWISFLAAFFFMRALFLSFIVHCRQDIVDTVFNVLSYNWVTLLTQHSLSRIIFGHFHEFKHVEVVVSRTLVVRDVDSS